MTFYGNIGLLHLLFYILGLSVTLLAFFIYHYHYHYFYLFEYGSKDGKCPSGQCDSSDKYWSIKQRYQSEFEDYKCSESYRNWASYKCWSEKGWCGTTEAHCLIILKKLVYLVSENDWCSVSMAVLVFLMNDTHY